MLGTSCNGVADYQTVYRLRARKEKKENVFLNIKFTGFDSPLTSRFRACVLCCAFFIEGSRLHFYLVFFGINCACVSLRWCNDPFLQHIQKELLELRMRKGTSFYWPKESLFLLRSPFFQEVTNLSSKLGNIITYKDWHSSQKDPNIHLYRILAANWLKDLYEISQSFLLLPDQLTEAITHAATNLWHPMLLPDTFLDFKSNKEDPHFPTSLFSMVLYISKIQYFLFDKSWIFIMTIPIPSTEEFQLFETTSNSNTSRF